MAVEMQVTETTDWHNRRVMHRAWYNTRSQLHRTTGPALERWTVLPDGARALFYEGWYLNGQLHRVDRPAARHWHTAADGARVLVQKQWWRHGVSHRVAGPSNLAWTVGPDGLQTVPWEWWRVNGKLHRVDGPALDGSRSFWYDVEVRQEDLPWLRRGRRGLLVPLAARAITAQQHGDSGSGSSTAWSRDPRVTLLGTGSVSTALATYRSAVGGAVMQCV